MDATNFEIAWLEIADEPDLWRSIGYAVDDDGRCWIGGVEHRLIGSSQTHHGLCGWAIRRSGADHSTDPDQPDIIMIDGLETKVLGLEPTDDAVADDLPDPAHPAHPNGVTAFDHLVMTTPDTPRTSDALEAFGLQRRGHRDSNSAGDRVHMTFFWIGGVLLELVGPGTSDPAEAGRPAQFSGIAYVSEDLDATAASLGEHSTEPRDAIQPGRRICALRKEAGSTLPMAFMTPHVKNRS